ncbi:putative EF-TU receptor [Hibiscus syriacus]|uniref:EF-TU receptor n=1 Tax=Hibiscus syriacus TaxID=106335 RepID=A0A6A3BCA1_HIBSY|nr:uncharacterized protein LOC120113674 [Hibiscus syriacus]KAE8713228.1 putative EF-TU receptor [Hibiscus syriacus]
MVLSLVADGGSFSSKSTLQILDLEAAKTMSRHVALYNSVSDDEFLNLRQGPMKSRGVAFLNSIDEGYLLGLACKEKLEDLGHAVAVVSRFSKKCNDEELNRFDIVYHFGHKKQKVDTFRSGEHRRSSGTCVSLQNLIVTAERCFHSTTSIGDEARENMFEMLPISLKQVLRRKLKGQWSKDSEESDGGQGLTHGWEEALEDIIGWLAPMAVDTLRWQQERELEQQELDVRQTVLLLQTLHFSDLEKTEVAIVEVLVGLSCIYRYENLRGRHVDGCRWL